MGPNTRNNKGATFEEKVGSLYGEDQQEEQEQEEEEAEDDE